MTDEEVFDRLMDIALGFSDGVRQELQARWDAWALDISQNEVHEVAGALLARQATLACQIAENPSIWNGHTAPLLLRAMVDVHITLGWILCDPPDRARAFIHYGLGQEKLRIEHCRAELKERTPEDGEEEALEQAERWISSQRLTYLTEVNLGSWSDLNTRQMADEAGCLDFYNSAYGPASACIHSMWHHVARLNLRACQNPLHRFHSVPDIPDLQSDVYYLLVAAEDLQKTFQLFDEATGVSIDTRPALELLEEGLNGVMPNSPVDEQTAQDGQETES